VYLQQFTTFFANTIVLGWFPTLYIQLGGLPREQALILTVITGAIQVVLAYVIALTVDRVGRIPYFKLGYALALVGTLLGLILTSMLHFTAWPVLWLAGTLIIVGGLFNADIAIVWIPEQYPTRCGPRDEATRPGGAFDVAATWPNASHYTPAAWRRSARAGMTSPAYRRSDCIASSCVKSPHWKAATR
jgi:MFS family permease